MRSHTFASASSPGLPAPPATAPRCCRLGRAPLVCTRWRALCQRPALLRQMVFKVTCLPDNTGTAHPTALLRLGSLWQVLLRHGGEVRSLTIKVNVNMWAAPNQLSPAAQQEVSATLHGCLAAAPAQHQLRQRHHLAAPGHVASTPAPPEEAVNQHGSKPPDGGPVRPDGAAAP